MTMVLGMNSPKEGNTGWKMDNAQDGQTPQPQALLQALLGPMKVPCSKGWHTGAPLGVCQLMIQSSSGSPPSEQNEGGTGLTPQRTIRRTSGC
jgi:hypothetical protein